MTSTTPRISVALCTFNGERFLPELLQSLLSQDRLPDELVVRDDRSTDGTIGVVESFASRAPFPVHLEVNDRNLGPSRNFEVAIAACTGDLIAPCDQDDVWLPAKLATAEEAFRDHPDIAYSFSDAELIDESGNRLGTRLWPAQGFSPARQEIARRGDLLQLLVLYTFVTGSTMTIRSDIRDLAFPLPDGWFHDAWIALVGAFVRPYHMIDSPLMCYRIHGNQEIGVPEIPMPEDTWITRWKLRLKQVPDLKSTDLNRQRRRIQADLFRGAADRFAEAADRYIAIHGGSRHPFAEETIRDLRARSEHLKLRGTLPDRRARRLGPVLAELRSGRYGRYSAGAFSALQDLVY